MRFLWLIKLIAHDSYNFLESWQIVVVTCQEKVAESYFMQKEGKESLLRTRLFGIFIASKSV